MDEFPDAFSSGECHQVILNTHPWQVICMFIEMDVKVLYDLCGNVMRGY